MNGLCLYIYCISRDVPSLHELCLEGVESERVLFLQHKDLAVAFSKVPWKVVSLNKRVRDPGWVAKRVREHEYIVEEVMRNHAILPVKFLTLFKSERSLLKALNPHLRELDYYLEYIQGKEEWSLKAYCNELRGLERIVETNVYLREMNRRTFRTPGEQYLHRKRMQELANEGLGDTLNSIVQDICEAVASLSVEWMTMKVHERKITQRMEDMLLNGAFLVSRQMLDAFKEKVEDLKESYGQWGLLFELAGPWPPYNFCPKLEGAVTEKAAS